MNSWPIRVVTFTVKLRKPLTPENFKNVYCVLANHKKVQDSQANLKIITIDFFGLIILCLSGLFLATQQHSINISGVDGFMSFTETEIFVYQ